MFVETISAPRDEFERWNDRLRLVSEPPPALVASIAWDAGGGQVTGVNVWDSPEAVADFFMDRVRHIPEAERESANKPVRHGEPIVAYMRR